MRLGRPFSLRWAIAVGALVTCVLAVLSIAAFVGATRVATTSRGDSLAARTSTLAAGLSGLPKGAAAREAARAGAAIRTSPTTGQAPSAPLALRLWSPSGDGWRLRGRTVEASAVLPEGRILVARQAVPGWVEPTPLVIGAAAGLVLVLGVAAGLIAGAAAGRRRVRSDAQAAALDEAESELARLRSASDAGIDVLGAALGPLRQPVAARAAAGRSLRNEPLERLLAELPTSDARALEAELAATIAASGPVARTIDTSDGRHLEIEGWSIPGARVAAVDDRREEHRLGELRRRMAGGAAARLGAPLAEARAAAGRVLVSASRPAADEAAKALAAIDRAEQLVGAMVRGGEADSRARRERPRRVGVAGALWSVARDWDERLARRHVQVDVRLDPAVPAAWVDPDVLADILRALVRNAVDFTPPGGRIVLSAGPAGDLIAISVSDSGPGVDPVEARDILEPFARGASAAARPGAGLGLATASALATRAGGRLRVLPGPGGRVELELPTPPRSVGGYRDGGEETASGRSGAPEAQGASA